MRAITFLQPQRLTFGNGCMAQAVEYLKSLPERRIHIVHSASMSAVADDIRRQLESSGCTVSTDCAGAGEPTIDAFNTALARARGFDPTCVLGVGGGSALDLAKLIAAFTRSDQRIEEVFGIGLLDSRNCGLVCVPTTSGTGSEVSPNAILLDEAEQLKKGVISPHLVPDAALVDPELTRSVPPTVTAYTGLDALTHCVEAYTNKVSHAMVDLYALEGVRLCARFLARAVANGEDVEAREGMSLASLYGGLCLGPVNTAAVHALAYPLGGEFHLPHGLSNAVLLPAVFRFNAEASPERHAMVAQALGVARRGSAMETARAGAKRLEELARECGIDTNLSSHGLERASVPRMAAAAMTVTRLLRNNPREITEQDAERIYEQCFGR
ncbi:MAG TPA: iron-containing alcohol dehydrogenase [Candidatus Aquilonibacter sp.]|nr:iron-containing alcohol dehydrogenase [Candidatus Aquilonibacter sp.]